jgi:hypothetical protein
MNISQRSLPVDRSPILRAFSDTAFPLLAAGFSPVPVVWRTKRPALSGWPRCCSEPLHADVIERFARSPIPYGVGLALGYRGLVAIDIDTDDPEVLAAIREVLA